MKNILGLDLGTNSIGWAMIDCDSKTAIESGVKVSNQYSIDLIVNDLEQNIDRWRLTSKENKTNKISWSLVFLIFISCSFALLTIINDSNWQLWMNFSFSALIVTLTLLHTRNTNDK